MGKDGVHFFFFFSFLLSKCGFAGWHFTSRRGHKRAAKVSEFDRLNAPKGNITLDGCDRGWWSTRQLFDVFLDPLFCCCCVVFK